MNRWHPADRGFTLIELLVTLMLMTVTVTLVAPGLFNTLAGVEQKQTVQELAQDVAWLRNQAFLQEYRLEVTLQDNLIAAYRVGAGGERFPEPYFEKRYPQVRFSEQTFSVSANGVADAGQIEVDLDGRRRPVEVGSW